jgi:very-short-patch-repair endonuclease
VRALRGSGRNLDSPVTTPPLTGSVAEQTLQVQLEQAGIPFVREFVVAPPRKYRADFFIGGDLLIEVEGGGYVNGRHSRGAGMENDCEKSALAAARGYRLIRVTPAQVDDERALNWIRDAITSGVIKVVRSDYEVLMSYARKGGYPDAGCGCGKDHRTGIVAHRVEGSHDCFVMDCRGVA